MDLSALCRAMPRGQRRPMGPLELELWMDANIMWVLGTKSRSSPRKASALKHAVTSAVPEGFTFFGYV